MCVAKDLVNCKTDMVPLYKEQGARRVYNYIGEGEPPPYQEKSTVEILFM